MQSIQAKFFCIPLLIAMTVLAEEPSTSNGTKSVLLGKAPVVRLPGESFQGSLPKLTDDETRLAKSLRVSVTKLSIEIGERNLREYKQLCDAADWLEESLAELGYEVERQTYKVDRRDCSNLIVERAGKTHPDEIVLIGAHYDSALGTPGANDNGSGTAALLELAKHFSKIDPVRTLRFVFFVNEEPPHFKSETMGSLIYARRCKERNENLVAVLSLETMGYYSDDEGSQKYPPPLGAALPTRGNYIGFVGNVDSGPLTQIVLNSFRNHTQFPSEGTSLPGVIEGVGWSDHWSFWEFGYQGVMVTDTAPFRYLHYHRRTDTPNKLDYERMARVVVGLEKVIGDLTKSDQPLGETVSAQKKTAEKPPIKKVSPLKKVKRD